jgi:hypothetical protein
LVEVFADGVESGGVQLVKATVAVGGVGDEAGLLEDFEVLGDGGAGDGEVFGELADGEWAAREAREDGSAGGIAEGVELGVLVSVHLR